MFTLQSAYNVDYLTDFVVKELISNHEPFILTRAFRNIIHNNKFKDESISVTNKELYSYFYNYINTTLEKNNEFALCLMLNTVPMGFIGTYYMNNKTDLYLQYGITDLWRDNGLFYTLWDKYMCYLYDNKKFGKQPLHAKVLKSNLASIKCLKKVNFKVSNTFDDYYIFTNFKKFN